MTGAEKQVVISQKTQSGFMLEEAQQGLVSVPNPKPAPARMILEVVYIADEVWGRD